jgi:hypothetical protein
VDTSSTYIQRAIHPKVVYSLEVEAELYGLGSWRHVVRPAERREEVVKRCLVRQIDDREAQAPLVAVSVEEVVSSRAGVEQAARRDALRIVVVTVHRERGYL